MVKKGDTLIEVTLAIGIFSMIAIGITAVMSSGTAGAQTALETTLTREEIDTQAEALRFIQTAYASDKDSADNRFTNLWNTIKDHAITNLNQLSADRQEAILQFNPATCTAVFDSADVKSHAFILNPRKLGTFTSSTDSNNANGVYSVFIPESTNKLTPASIYPRLVFTNIAQDAQDALIDNTENNNLYRAEGIYVLAVKDSDVTQNSGTTAVAGDFGIDKLPAYYDFYIRACWYGTDANEPSTISTVIRLYDPDVTK